jgi:hypothetical protein
VPAAPGDDGLTIGMAWHVQPPSRSSTTPVDVYNGMYPEARSASLPAAVAASQLRRHVRARASRKMHVHHALGHECKRTHARTQEHVQERTRHRAPHAALDRMNTLDLLTCCGRRADRRRVHANAPCGMARNTNPNGRDRAPSGSLTCALRCLLPLRLPARPTDRPNGTIASHSVDSYRLAQAFLWEGRLARGTGALNAGAVRCLWFGFLCHSGWLLSKS